MRLCGEKVDAQLADIDREKKKFQSDYARYQQMRDGSFEEFYETFKHWIYFSDEDERITILRGYCQPSPNKKHKGLWYVVGYVEYLKQPLDGWGEAEVDKTSISESIYSWRKE